MIIVTVARVNPGGYPTQDSLGVITIQGVSTAITGKNFGVCFPSFTPTITSLGVVLPITDKGLYIDKCQCGYFIPRACCLLHMGNKNTSGYGLQLPDQGLVVKGDSDLLKVQWSEPAPGVILSQVLTNPCLLVRMLLDDYHHIEVCDQNNDTRIEQSL